MTWMPAFLLRLIADTPSLVAAAKAGRETSIAAVVLRGCRRCEGCLGLVRDAEGRAICLNPRREFRGRISFHETDWRRHLPQWLHQMAAEWQAAPPEPRRPGEGRVIVEPAKRRVIVQIVDQNGREIERVTD